MKKICLCYVIGGPYVSDQAGLNRGPLILNLFIVTLYTLLRGSNKYISDSDSPVIPHLPFSPTSFTSQNLCPQLHEINTVHTQNGKINAEKRFQ